MSLYLSFKEVFLPNLLAPPEIYPFFVISYSLFPLSSILHPPVLVCQLSVFTNYSGNCVNQIHKNNMNRYASTNSQFPTCQENYVTTIEVNEICRFTEIQ